MVVAKKGREGGRGVPCYSVLYLLVGCYSVKIFPWVTSLDIAPLLT